MTDRELIEILIKRFRKWPTVPVPEVTNEEIKALANMIEFVITEDPSR